MKEKLKAHFLKLGPRRFVVLTVMSLVITDVVNCFYLKLYWASKNMSQLLLARSLSLKGIAISDFSRDALEAMLGMLNNFFYFLLFVILLNNLFFYLFYLRRKLWAQGFVLFYAATAGLMQLTFLFDNAGLGTGWFTYNLLTLPYYLYVFLGVKLLRAETTDPKVAPAGTLVR